MGSTAWPRLLCLLAASSFTQLGCFADRSLPPDLEILCEETSDCPEGWVCRKALGRCLRADGLDDTAPTFIEPPSASPARVSQVAPFQTSEISFVLDEDVGTHAPFLLVTLANRPLTCSVVAQGAGHRYRCPYTVTAADEEGSQEVTVLAADADGNVVSERTSVRFDFSGPALLSVVASPAAGAVALGDTQLLRVLFDEPLAAPPSLTASRAADGATFALALDDAPGGGVFTFSHVVAEGQDGDWSFTLDDIVDEVGNPAAPASAGSAVLDATAPTLSSVQADRARYSAVSDFQGEDFSVVTITVDVSEPPARVDAFIGLTPMTCEPCTTQAPGAVCVCTHAIVENAEAEGRQGVLVTVQDAAGNLATHTSLSVDFDFTGPTVVAGTEAVQLLRGPSNLLVAPEAVTLDTTVLVSFAVTEPTGEPSQLFSLPDGVSFAQTSGAGVIHVFEGAMLAAWDDGERSLSLTARWAPPARRALRPTPRARPASPRWSPGRGRLRGLFCVLRPRQRDSAEQVREEASE